MLYNNVYASVHAKAMLSAEDYGHMYWCMYGRVGEVMLSDTVHSSVQGKAMLSAEDQSTWRKYLYQCLHGQVGEVW